MASKYQRWYDQLIERAFGRRLDEYFERHHILPRSLGGGDENTNLVDLTYREHFLAHWLLAKIYDGAARRSMVYALHCMTMALGRRLVAGWQVEIAKRAVRDEVRRSAVARQERWKKARKAALTQEWDRFEAAKKLALNCNPAIGKDRDQLSSLANTLMNNRRLRIKKVYDANSPKALFEKPRRIRPKSLTNPSWQQQSRKRSSA